MNKDVKRADAERKALLRKAKAGKNVNSRDVARYQRAKGMASKLFYQSVNVDE